MIENFAAELVPEHHIARQIHRLATWKMPGQLDHPVGVLARMEVGTADAAGERLDQHLTVTGPGFGDLIDHDLTAPENGCAHVLPPLKSKSASRQRKNPSRRDAALMAMLRTGRQP
jgi:hypothetical protein